MLDEEIVKHLESVKTNHSVLTDVRFGTKKLKPDFKPQPIVQVIIFMSERPTLLKAWGNKTILVNNLAIVHTYSGDAEKAKQVSNFVSQLLDGLSTKTIRGVQIVAHPFEINYEQNETLYYSSVESF